MATKPKRSTAPAKQRRATRSKPEQRETRGNQRGNLNRIGALWLSRNRTRQGDRYMTGRLQLDDNTEIRLMVFKNGYKEEERHPDYIIYEPESQQDTAARDTQAKGKGKADYDDSDIPF